MAVAKKEWLRELYWLPGILVGVYFLGILFYKDARVLSLTVDLQLRDTSFVATGWSFLVYFFATIGSIFYFIRCFSHRFRKVPANTILCAVLGLLLFVTFRWHNIMTVSLQTFSEWALRTAVDQPESFESKPSPVFTIINITYTIVEIILVLSICFLAFKTGKQVALKKNQ